MKISISDFLLKRLKEANVNHIFGVPGDFNLGFLDNVVEDPELTWVGNCNELNGAYAADGYSRIRGMSAIVTTFGVGELSAMNGIAGAYAEFVPIVNIVGMPATAAQNNRAIVHHTLGEGNYNDFVQMFSNVSVYQTVLTEFNAVEQIDKALYQCWLNKRPVYIGIPTDIAGKQVDIEDVVPIVYDYPVSNSDAIKEIVFRIERHLQTYKNPVILVDIGAKRHNMGPLIEQFIEHTGIPFAALCMGKGIINESHPKYLGLYVGKLSEDSVREYVEASDAVICFGTLLSDMNTGGFTADYKINMAIEIQSNSVSLGHSKYQNVYFKDVIPQITENLKGVSFDSPDQTFNEITYQPGDSLISQERFWQRISLFLEKDEILLAEAGTSMFGSLPIKIPDGVMHVCQTLWSSIGYTLGGALGTAIADRNRGTVLIIGDGSFQLTAQEISTMFRQNLHPIIFLINNDGYTVEREIHGPTMLYNDIQMWRYSELPKMFGDNVWTTKISNENELEVALEELRKNSDKLRFIEVIMDRMDSPKMLKTIGQMLQSQNKYE